MLRHPTIPLTHAPSAYVLFVALLPAFDFCAADRLVTGLLAAGVLVGGSNEKAGGGCGVSTVFSGLLDVGEGGEGGVGRCFHFLSVARVPKAYRCFAPNSALALEPSGSSNVITSEEDEPGVKS